MSSTTCDLTQEAKLMSKLSQHAHPSLLPLLCVEYDAWSRVSMVVPIARFGSVLDLMDHLDFEGIVHMFTARHTALAVAQLLAGVAHLHTLGYVHGDLAARNVLVFDFDCLHIDVKLGDFGCARPGKVCLNAVASLVRELFELLQ